MVTTGKLTTLEEYLALPEDKPYAEFVDGEVVRKVAPQSQHSVLQVQIGRRIASSPLATDFLVMTEARYILGQPLRAYLPDVSVIARTRLPRDARGRVENRLDLAPEIAFEIISPGQPSGALLDKISFYLASGVDLVVVVDPDRSHVIVYRRGQAPVTISAPGKLNLAPVIPSLEIDLGELFAELDLD